MAVAPDSQAIGQAAAHASRLLAAGDAHGAAGRLAPVIPHAGGMPRILELYGRCLLQLGQHEAALEPLRDAARQMPDNADAGFNLVMALRRCADYEAALQEVRRVRTLQPAAAVPAAMEADLLLDLGRDDEALKVLAAAEAHGPFAAPDRAQLDLVRATLARDDEALALAREMLATAAAPGLAPRMPAMLHNAAGRLLHRAGQRDEAFAAFGAAQRLKAVPWDPEVHSARIDAALAFFATGAGRDLPSATGADSGLVFIVGMPRSGTSLLEQMLGRHPGVDPLGECPGIMQAAARLDPPPPGLLPLPADARTDPAALAVPVAEAYAARRGGAALATDKNPFNYYYLPLIARLVPGARVIHTTRDPMDTCWSNFRQWFNDPHGHLGNLDWLGRYYLDYRRMMDAWRALPAPAARPPMIEVNYEALIDEPEARLAEVCEFLGIEFLPDMLNPEASDRIVATASRRQLRRGLNRDSIGAWRAYADHLEPLAKLLGAVADEER